MTDTKPLVGFRSKYNWAVLPLAPSIGSDGADFDPQEFGFRWARLGRSQSQCMPFRLATKFGWDIPSPIDIALEPIEQFSFCCEDEEIEAIAKTMGFVEIWKRDDVYYGSVKHSGLRLHDFETESGWEAMFLPNGENSIEWRLGWEMRLPLGYAALVLPTIDLSSLGVLHGILPFKTVERMNEATGFSLAVRPTEKIQIRRGQTLARVALISEATLGAKYEYVK